MKQKYTITIADIQMNIITDEAPEAVETVVGILDRKMREIALKSGNRCPKNEAALLCALDYCAERTKLQETVTRLESERAGTDAEALIAEVTELRTRVEDITAKLAYSEEQRESLHADLENMTARMHEALLNSDSANTAKSELDGRVGELLAQLREATELAAREKEEKETLARTAAEKEADFNEALGEMESLIEDNNQKLSETELRVSELEQ